MAPQRARCRIRLPPCGERSGQSSVAALPGGRVIGIDLLPLTLRGAQDGKAVSFSESATRNPDGSSATIAVYGVNLRYQDCSASGTLRIHTARGTHDVPRVGALPESFSGSGESKFRERF